MSNNNFRYFFRYLSEKVFFFFFVGKPTLLADLAVSNPVPKSRATCARPIAVFVELNGRGPCDE